MHHVPSIRLTHNFHANEDTWSVNAIFDQEIKVSDNTLKVFHPSDPEQWFPWTVQLEHTCLSKILMQVLNRIHKEWSEIDCMIYWIWIQMYILGTHDVVLKHFVWEGRRERERKREDKLEISQNY